MAHFLRKQITEGPLKGQWEWVMKTTGSVAPDVTTATLNTVTLTHKKRFECKVCSKTYANVNIFANHFNHSHKELVKDKDTWRANVVDTKGA
jgi:hypothetical protein